MSNTVTTSTNLHHPQRKQWPLWTIPTSHSSLSCAREALQSTPDVIWELIVAYLAHIPMIKCALHGSLTIPYAPRMVNITRMSGGYIAYSLLGSTEIFIFNPSINATIKCVTESKSSIQTIICNNGVELVVIQCSGECSVFGVLDRHAFTVQKRYHTDFKHSRNYEATTTNQHRPNYHNQNNIT